MSGRRIAIVVAAVVVVVAIGGLGYWLGNRHGDHAQSSIASTARRATTTTTGAPATTTSTAGSPLTISVEPSSPSGLDSSILLPASCVMTGNTVTAAGTFNGGFAPELYARVGAVVELYVYTGAPTGNGQGVQIAELNGGEQPSPIYKDGNSWTVTATVDPTNGTPATCVVAVQATHDFMGAGNVGG